MSARGPSDGRLMLKRLGAGIKFLKDQLVRAEKAVVELFTNSTGNHNTAEDARGKRTTSENLPVLRKTVMTGATPTAMGLFKY
uniref:Transposase n=1 Tax=Steinernema glaseri TaxID=37863 RepID=A0A1I7YI57_9BILA